MLYYFIDITQYIVFDDTQTLNFDTFAIMIKKEQAAHIPTWKKRNVAAVDSQSIIEMRLLHKGNPNSAHNRQPSHQGLEGQPDPAREEEVAHPDPHGQEIRYHFANPYAGAHMEFGEGFDNQLDILLPCPSDIQLNYDFATDVLCLVHLCRKGAQEVGRCIMSQSLCICHVSPADLDQRDVYETYVTTSTHWH